jgi:hypothetical protein
MIKYILNPIFLLGEFHFWEKLLEDKLALSLLDRITYFCYFLASYNSDTIKWIPSLGKISVVAVRSNCPKSLIVVMSKLKTKIDKILNTFRNSWRSINLCRKRTQSHVRFVVLVVGLAFFFCSSCKARRESTGLAFVNMGRQESRALVTVFVVLAHAWRMMKNFL